MSIEIRQGECTGCGRCAAACPGSLIRIKNGRASILRLERCWGCASCVKECPEEALALFLGADIGGRGGRLTARREKTLLHWTVTLPDGLVRTITVDSRDASKY